MIEKMRGTVEAVQMLSSIRDGFCKMIIRIDFDEYYIFYDPQAIMGFLHKDVIYNTRPDIVEGKEVEVIAEIALVTEVVALEATTNDIKLVPFDTKRPVCNFNIKEVRFGEYKIGCVAILTDIKEGSSRKANWFDCEMLDAYGHMFEVRMFTSKEDVLKLNEYKIMVNGYVEFNMESTKYGYQTSEISALPQEIEASPEIAIAKNEVMKYIQSDPAIYAMVNDYKLDSYIDMSVDGEPGYQWVRMASELYFINALDNVTSGVSISSMKRAVICTRLSALPHKSSWSETVLNVTKVLRYKDLVADEELRKIIDVFYNDEVTPTKRLYIEIRKMVNQIINARRDIENEEEVIGTINSCRNAFAGLL